MESVNKTILFYRDNGITYYRNNKALPVYGKPKKGYNKEKILHILLDPSFNPSLLCTDHPVQVEHNIAFVIDSSKLKSRSDIGADDMGTWICTGSRILTFFVQQGEELCHIVSSSVMVQNSGEPVFIRRQYHVHGTDSDFHRMTAYIDNSKGGVPSSRCLLQYWFESGNEHSINIKAHGNSKVKSKSYCRTNPSTLAALKKRAVTCTPKETVNAIYTAEGGILEANSLGSLPRNREQVANLRRSLSGNSVPLYSKKGLKDPLFMVMEQSKLCGDNFVRFVTATPEPMSILATDQQLRDLERFSTNSNCFSVVCIDPTFSLGDFSVTCLAYRQLLVVCQRTSQSPIMLGPILVHQRKTFQTYHFFSSSLVSLRPSLDKLLAFGTDGEEALAMAFQKQFRLAIHLGCFRHLKQNIHRKLTTDMGLKENEASEILCHIFGVKSGPKFFEGLVDAPDDKSFDERLMHLENTWGQICSKSDKQGISFHSWFTKYHSNVIKANMLKPVRQSAGLGDPPSEFSTNDSEAINSTLKQFLNFKKLDWQVFNEKIKEFIINQQAEVEKSLVGIGQYSIRQEYQQFKISSSRWFTSLNTDQKKAAVLKFNSASVEDKCQTNNNSSNEIDASFPLTSIASPSATSNHQNNQTLPVTSIIVPSTLQHQNNYQLSVSIDDAANITGLPILFLRQVWSKATELLTEDKVIQAPCSSLYSRIVASTSMKKPHFVSTKDGTLLFECDDNCPGFSQRYICTHTISAAEHNNVLRQYLTCFGEFTKTPKGSRQVAPNFTRLSMSGLPRGTSGRKGGKAPRKTAVKRRKIVDEENRYDISSTFTSDDDPAEENSTACSGNINASVCPTRVQPNMRASWDTTTPSYCDPGFYYPPQYSYDRFYQLQSASFPSQLPFTDVTTDYYEQQGLLPDTLPDHSATSTGNSLPMTSASLTTPPASPFYITLLTGRIKVCAGCKGVHMKDALGQVLPSPNNLCIVHKEHRSFINPKTGLECSKLGNSYYHINIACLLKKHPKFTSSQLVCADDLNLDVAQKTLLQSTLGFMPVA